MTDDVLKYILLKWAQKRWVLIINHQFPQALNYSSSPLVVFCNWASYEKKILVDLRWEKWKWIKERRQSNVQIDKLCLSRLSGENNQRLMTTLNLLLLKIFQNSHDSFKLIIFLYRSIWFIYFFFVCHTWFFWCEFFSDCKEKKLRWWTGKICIRKKRKLPLENSRSSLIYLKWHKWIK